MRPDSAIFPVENGNPGDPWPKPKLYTSRRERYSGPRTPRGASHGTAARSPEGTEPSVDARIGGTTVPLGKCTAWVGLRWDFPLQRTGRPSPTPWAVPLPPVRRRREGAGGAADEGRIDAARSKNGIGRVRRKTKRKPRARDRSISPVGSTPRVSPVEASAVGKQRGSGVPGEERQGPRLGEAGRGWPTGRCSSAPSRSWRGRRASGGRSLGRRPRRSSARIVARWNGPRS
jgi:hypothetical protein